MERKVRIDELIMFDVNDKVKCCICGKKIRMMETNNPYPVLPWSRLGEKKNRCCKKCNDDYVFPARLKCRYHNDGSLPRYPVPIRNGYYMPDSNVLWKGKSGNPGEMKQ